MKTLTLNIGAAIPNSTEMVTRGDLQEILDRCNFIIDSVQEKTVTHAHGTELTYIVKAKAAAEHLIGRIDMMSTVLGQDAIAYYDHADNKGFLVGPRADAWGDFNPDYFHFNA